MAGGARAVSSGDDLCKAVCDLGKTLGLDIREQFRVARRIWGRNARLT